MGCVVGIIFVFQAVALKLCKFYVRCILFCVPVDRKLGPLVYKNLDSHSLKNLKANLLYSVTICFLVFQATNFLAITTYISQMCDTMFGGDITLMSIEPRSIPQMNEIKLKEVIDYQLEDENSVIKAYSFTSANV